MEIRVGEWRSRWCRGKQGHAEKLRSLMREVASAEKDRRKTQGYEELFPSDSALVSTLGLFPAATAATAVGFSPKEVASLPVEARDGFRSILNRIHKELQLPLTDMIALICFLGKPTGGERPIAILGLCYRVIMARLRPRSAAWCEKRAGHWDTAIKGCSALQAGLARSLGADVANLLGDEAVLALWDGA
eukprot:3872768-Lingulodinium_polyedra.AAC.1